MLFFFISDQNENVQSLSHQYYRSNKIRLPKTVAFVVEPFSFAAVKAAISSWSGKKLADECRKASVSAVDFE